MAEISEVRRRRLVNPGKRKRKLSALQKLFFGSKRQRAAVKANRGKRKRNAGKFSARKTLKRIRKKELSGTLRSGVTARTRKGLRRISSATRKSRKRKTNVGSIVTVLPFGNPGSLRKRGKRKMAVKRRRARKHNVVYRKRIKRGVYQYSSNPGRRHRRRKTNVVARRRSYRRHSNPSMRRKHYRRRNPGFSGGFMSGTGGSVLGVIGGVAITKFLSGFLPAQFQSGVLGYLGIGAVAVAQGKLIGKVSKNAAFGNHMMIGGLAYLTAKVLSDFFPSIGGYTGISGIGLIGGSQFYVPQVNQGGSMGSFVPIGQAMPQIAAGTTAGNRGMGTMRRTGRLM